MLFSAITIYLVISHVRPTFCMVNPQCKFSVRTVTSQNYAPYPGAEICHDVGVVLEPYLYLKPSDEHFCRKICLKKPVSECYNNFLAVRFCCCLRTRSDIANGYSLCENTSVKSEYSGPLSDWYCKNTCSHPYLPISVSTCAKDPVARFACLCDGYAMGPSVFPPWFEPLSILATSKTNSDKICTNVAPRREFYR